MTTSANSHRYNCIEVKTIEGDSELREIFIPSLCEVETRPSYMDGVAMG